MVADIGLYFIFAFGVSILCLVFVFFVRVYFLFLPDSLSRACFMFTVQCLLLWLLSLLCVFSVWSGGLP